MWSARILWALLSVIVVSSMGCVVGTVSVRQDDGTYKTQKEIYWRTFEETGRRFTCNEDYMVATKLRGVTYAWPRGKGYFPNTRMIKFTSDTLNCEVYERNLVVNGQNLGEFEWGDRVRITPDGQVSVNDEDWSAGEVTWDSGVNSIVID